MAVKAPVSRLETGAFFSTSYGWFPRRMLLVKLTAYKRESYNVLLADQW